MTSVLDEPKVEGTGKIRGSCACCGDPREVAKQIERGVNDAKRAVCATVDDGKMAATRLLKRGRYTMEDGVSEAAHAIKHRPFGSLAIAFAAGAALAFLLPRIAKK